MVIKAFKIPINRIKIGTHGADIACQSFPSYFSEFLIAISGTAANIITAIISFFIFQNSGGYIPYELMWSSVALAMINILPALPLDGGVALWALLKSKLDLRIADTVINIISKAIAVAIAFIASYLIFYGIEELMVLPLVALSIICWNGIT